MGSRGQSRKRQLAQLDRASEKYNSLQEHADHVYMIGNEFVDTHTGKSVPREEVEKLDKDLKEARERFEDLRDKMIERENAAAQRDRERAEKRAATREANKLPAGVRVTFPDGTTRIYARGANGIVTDQYGYPLNVARGMKYNDLIQQIRSNQGASGVKIDSVSSGELKTMREVRREAERNKPDYEMGIGTPWGNKDNRRAARASRLAGRVARRSR